MRRESSTVWSFLSSYRLREEISTARSSSRVKNSTRWLWQALRKSTATRNNHQRWGSFAFARRVPETDLPSALYHLGACENSVSQAPFLYVRFAWRASSNRRDRRPRRSVYILYHNQIWYTVPHSVNFFTFSSGEGGPRSGFPEASRAELWGFTRRWMRRSFQIAIMRLPFFFFYTFFYIINNYIILKPYINIKPHRNLPRVSMRLL